MKKISVHEGIAYFVVAHSPPLFAVPSYYNLVKTTNYECTHSGPVFYVTDYVANSEDLRPADDYLADYASVLILNLLRESKDVHGCFTAIHRKMVLARPAGLPAKNYPGMYISHASDFFDDYHSENKSRTFLVSRPLFFNDGIASQYARKHSSKDFYKFVELALGSGVLRAEEVKSFFYSKILYPALPLGLLPINFALDMLTQATRFIRYSDLNGYSIEFPDDPYQSRARSFFLERLMSFVFTGKLTSHIGSFKKPESRQAALKDTDFGYITTFTEEAILDPVYIHGKK
jgi:hypothetical protein